MAGLFDRARILIRHPSDRVGQRKTLGFRCSATNNSPPDPWSPVSPKLPLFLLPVPIHRGAGQSKPLRHLSLTQS
jgi:hypothetical protein